MITINGLNTLKNAARRINYECPRVKQAYNAVRERRVSYNRDVFFKSLDEQFELAAQLNREAIIENTEKISNKISKYLRILPKDSKMKEPSTFELNGRTFEMLVSKNSKGNSKVTIKRLEKDLPHDSYKREDSTLDLIFDDKNQMIAGHFTSGNTMHSYSYSFERLPRNQRRIHFEETNKGVNYGQVSYMPARDVKGSWKCVDSSVSKYYTSTPGMISPRTFEEDELGRIFFDLTGLNKKL